MPVMFKQIQAILNAPWAIRPEMLDQIVAIAHAHARGDQLDLAAFRIGGARGAAPEPAPPYTINQGVAVVNIEGVLARKMNMMMEMCGGTSTDMLQQALTQAAQDPNVQGILLNVSSPGGSVFGIPATAQLVRRVATQKPVIAWTPDQMASAAMWLGAAANKILIADSSTMTGSLGVVATHVDLSKAEEMSGRKTTEITAGKYKRIASNTGPLTESGRAEIQHQVDQLYQAMVENVAAFRGVTPEQVDQQMADGRTFIGQEAITAGLVDGFASFEEAAAMARPRQTKIVNKGLTMDKPTTEQIAALSAEDLQAANPGLVLALTAAGATAERQRMLAVEAVALPGHEALVAQLRDDGKTTGPEAAAQILAAEKALRATEASGQASRPGAVTIVTQDEETVTGKATGYVAPAGFVVAAGQAALHAKAKALQAAEPGGLSFIDAVKKAQAAGV